MNIKLRNIFAGSDGTNPTEGGSEHTEHNENPKENPREGKGSSLTDNEANLLKEVMEKKNKISEQAKQIEELKNQLEEFGGVETIKSLVAEHHARQKEALEKKGEWEKLREQMVEEHAKATAGLRKEVDDLKALLQGEKTKMSEMTIGTAFSGSDFLKNKTVLPTGKARTIYGDYFDISESGAVIAYDKPRGAEGRTALVDQMGKNIDFESAIERIIKADPDSASLLRSESHNGSGSQTGGFKKTEETKSEKKSGVSLIAQGLASQKR